MHGMTPLVASPSIPKATAWSSWAEND